MVVTTGRFTGPAEEYAERLREGDDPHPIELLDGEALRAVADEVGLDLYNGRIEILCDETLRPRDPATAVDKPIREAFRDVENLDLAALPDPHTRVTFRPVVAVDDDVDATFETSVGVVHRVDDRSLLVARAERGRPELLDGDLARLVADNRHAAVDLDDAVRAPFDEVRELRFGRTKTEYTDWAVERLCERHTTTVSYTGDNNVTYTKTCEPTASDVSVRAVEAVYLPEVRQTVRLGEYAYPYEYHAAGPARVTGEDGVRRCVHCDTDAADETYTCCRNCGAIACEAHTRTERLAGTPVCTGCSVTGEFAFATKHFYDRENRAAFREQYAAMAPHEKAMENPRLVAGVAVFVLVALAALAAVGGV